MSAAIKIPLDEYLYEVILDAINAGVWVWDIETGEEWWSDKYYRLLGYEPGEIKASYNVFIDELVHPDDRHLLIDASRNPILAGVKKPIEIRLKMKDNSYRWFEAAGQVMHNEKGKAIKMTGSIIDRNDVRQYQIKLQQTLELTAGQNKKLNNFAYIVSHNLRSHVSNMQGLFAIYEQASDPEEKNEYIKQLNRISHSLNDTINNLDNIVHTQTPLTQSKTLIQFEDVFNSVIAVLSPAIANTGITITHDFMACTEIEYVHAYLESIFLNLMSNAIKYHTPSNDSYIKVKTFSSDKGPCLQVEDNGLGIDLEKYGTKIFGLYNVFHDHPDAKGVGLYITKNQIESLGGNISVKSEPGKGSIFLVEF